MREARDEFASDRIRNGNENYENCGRGTLGCESSDTVDCDKNVDIWRGEIDGKTDKAFGQRPGRKAAVTEKPRPQVERFNSLWVSYRELSL